jgi:hypothetical protein
VQAAVHAAVHASVHASVQAMLSSHLVRTRAAEIATPAVAANDDAEKAAPVQATAAGLAPAWTPAQRIYVLATTVALAALTTLVVHLALGNPSSDIAAATASARTARVATVTSPTSLPTVGSAPRKDAVVAAETTEGVAAAAAAAAAAQSAARRPAVRPLAPAPVVTTGRTTATNGTGAGAPSGTSSAKLDDAARSAKMLRDQLSSAVN